VYNEGGEQMHKKVATILIGVMLCTIILMGGAGNTYANEYIENYEVKDFRLAGSNRYDTAWEIAKRNHATANTVIIVRGDSVDGVPQVVDGMTASALAGRRGAPILLVDQDRVPNTTKDAIKGLAAKQAIIVGGESAVGGEVERDLKTLGLSVTRISGGDRFETAAKVAKDMGSPKENTAIIVNGASVVDSLVAGPLAYQGHPILMINNNRDLIPEVTKSAIKELGIEKLFIIGGYGVVSESIENQLQAIEGVTVDSRYGGRSRVETSLAMANHEKLKGKESVNLVNGGGYVDAVAASSLGNPILYFMESEGINRELEEFLDSKQHLYGIGGRSTISYEILQDATPVIAFDYYVDQYQKASSKEQHKPALIQSTMNLLRVAQRRHSQGEFQRSVANYDRILQHNSIMENDLVAAAMAGREKAVAAQRIKTHEEVLTEAGATANLKSKAGVLHENYPYYQWKKDYTQNLVLTFQELMNWSINRHNAKDYDVALDRYNFIIDKSGTVTDLNLVARDAAFYKDLAQKRITLHNQDLSMKVNKFNDTFGDALNQQIMQNSHTIWSSLSWESPEEEDIENYLNPDNFYIYNWLEDFKTTEYIKIATSTLRVRTGPSTSYDIIDTVSRDEVFKVLQETREWFQIQKSGKTGWVSGDFVHRDSGNQRISNLRIQVDASALNVRTGPSVSHERIGTISRGEMYTLRDHKDGWYKINYYGRDGWISGGFASVTHEIPADTFQFFTLNGASDVSASELNQLLAEDMELGNLGTLFYNAGRDQKINGVYLVAHALLESQSATGELVKGVRVESVKGESVTPRTVYNVFGIGAQGIDPVNAGAEFAYEQGWTSKEKAVEEGAAWIAENFIHRSGNPQDTLYKMRWDPGNRGNNPYTTNIRWAKEVGDNIHRFYQDLNKNPEHFDISVYKTRSWPVPGYMRISSYYGMRIHPITGEHRMHIGIDIPTGGKTPPIVAAKAGTVTVSRYGTSYGNWVEIDHGKGITTRYAHNSVNLVEVGEWVDQGQIIARVGTTGSSTGEHLHFEVRHNNNHFDPLPWLQGR